MDRVGRWAECQEKAHMSDDFDRDYDFEHGWQALAGLAGRMSIRLQSVQAANEYAPVSPWEVVPVEPCPFCADGGLRTAGYVSRDHKLLPVRQCDTCHAVEIGTHFFPGEESFESQDDAEDDEDDDEEEDDDDRWRRFG
jgi:hypothetical protein